MQSQKSERIAAVALTEISQRKITNESRERYYSDKRPCADFEGSRAENRDIHRQRNRRHSRNEYSEQAVTLEPVSKPQSRAVRRLPGQHHMAAFPGDGKQDV